MCVFAQVNERSFTTEITSLGKYMQDLKLKSPFHILQSIPGSTKYKIENAALYLFARQGIDGVSVKEIAQKACVSEGALYRHYPSKYKLAETLMLGMHQYLAHLVRYVEAESIKFRIKVKHLVQKYCQAADENWDFFAYHLLHLHHFPQLFGPSAMGSPIDSPISACADILEQAMDDGEIPTGNPQLLASMALGVVLQAASSKIYRRLKGSLSMYSADFDKAVWAIVKHR